MYVTEDGGATWRPSNQGVRAEFLPDKYPEFGQCVHKVVQSQQQARADVPAEPLGPLPQRRSRRELDRHRQRRARRISASRWPSIREDPDCAWIVPLESDEFRCTPEGKLRVYRTRDAGASWEPMTEGLPQNDAYETVLRDAMAVDPLDRVGVYFGTRSGKLFGSADEGESWSELLDGLPPVVAVKTAVRDRS